METLTDSELLSLLRDGNEEAFNQIYRRFKHPLIKYATKFIKDIEIANDAVQEVFIGVYQNSQILTIKSSLKSYLFSAVRYRLLTVISHEKIKNNYREAVANIPQSSTPTDQNLQLKELTNLIECGIKKMPGRMREIFELRGNHYLTQKEIADRLGIAENTVNNQVQRGLKKLRSTIII